MYQALSRKKLSIEIKKLVRSRPSKALLSVELSTSPGGSMADNGGIQCYSKACQPTIATFYEKDIAAQQCV
jgi:hypothetical protein